MKGPLGAACLLLLAATCARAGALDELRSSAPAAEVPAAPLVAPKVLSLPRNPIIFGRDASGIQIWGTAPFVEATKAALDKLRTLPQFALIRRDIGRIEESRCSGMSVRQRVFHVGSQTWHAETAWYASTISHDAYHVEVETKHGGPLADAGSEETACLNFQSGVLAAMGAPEMMVKYVDRLAKHPTYQNIGSGKTEFNTGTANDVCSERSW